MPDATYSGVYSSDYDRSGKHTNGASVQDIRQGKKDDKNKIPLTTRESIELFQNAVETSRHEHPKTTNGEAPGDILRPKLTVDLRHKQLNQIPKEVIAILRKDVERIQLAHNTISHIAYEFSQCSALKYLNLRDNKFMEIPKALFGLPQLEILDISENQLTEIPDEVEHMKQLRVLSVQQNNIRELPYCLGNISTLRMLKVIDNPLNPKIQRVIDESEFSPSVSPVLMNAEHQRDTKLTRKLREHLRHQAALRDSGEDSTSDGPLETPRALSRFPVQPQYSHSTSGSESASDLRSPVFTRSFLPARSQTRIPSSQYGTLQNTAPRRPGLAPLALGNERNRSNSESILQSTQNNKVKRMGLVTKKYNDLGPLDETRAHRNSYHLRGQSHGSALRNGVRAGDSSPSGGQSGLELLQRFIDGRRLESLPAQKTALSPRNCLVESSRGVLYTLIILLPLISTLASVIKDGKTRRSSIARDLNYAVMHIEHLDQELLRSDTKPDSHRGFQKQSKSVAQATLECVKIHKRIMVLLLHMVSSFAVDADPRFLRTLKLSLYGGMIEMSHAAINFVGDHSGIMPQKRHVQRVFATSERANGGDHLYKSDRSATPTQHRKPERRWKSGSTIQQTINHPNLPTPGAQTAVPLYSTNRSRSNSRVTPFHSSTSSSLVNTPRSGESFTSASFVARSRSGSVNVTSEQLQAEREETAQFERIFFILSKSAEEGLAIVSQLRPEFFHALSVAEQQNANPMIRDQWSSLAENTTYCMEITEALKTSLSAVRLNDREARNIRAFWQLAKSFLDSHGNLLIAIKEAIRYNLINPNMRHHLRPVHISTREAARLIATSPWNRLTFDNDPQATPQAPTQLQTQFPAQNGYQHRTRGSCSSTAGGSSPYPANVPATPLSAALGPAAQATVPASMANSQGSALPPTPAGTMPPTPGTASLERSFEGDIFQRADTYQSLQQTMIPRRH